MASNTAEKLLVKAHRTVAGWKLRELNRLYKGFGFVPDHGSNHDIKTHPKYPHLNATIPRSDPLAKGYIQYARNLIDELKRLEQGGK